MEAEAVAKRLREDGTEDNGAGGVSSIVEDGKTMDCISTVIPGWFSEMSPMWPGIWSLFLFACLFLFRSFGVVF